LADAGPTAGYAIIYEVQNVPEDVPVETVITAFKAFQPPKDRYEIDYSELTVAG
jgi:hypothetical protein